MQTAEDIARLINTLTREIAERKLWRDAEYQRIENEFDESVGHLKATLAHFQAKIDELDAVGFYPIGRPKREKARWILIDAGHALRTREIARRMTEHEGAEVNINSLRVAMHRADEFVSREYEGVSHFGLSEWLIPINGDGDMDFADHYKPPKSKRDAELPLK